MAQMGILIRNVAPRPQLALHSSPFSGLCYTRWRGSKRLLQHRKPRRASSGQRVGYLPMSTLEQNESRQLEGLELDRTFSTNLRQGCASDAAGCHARFHAGR